MRILILEHEPEAPAALFGDWASARGHELHVVAVPQLEDWPVAREHDVIVSLGSDSSVHSSPGRWIARELDYLRAAHADDIAILGICFGAEEVARHAPGARERAFDLFDRIAAWWLGSKPG